MTVYTPIITKWDAQEFLKNIYILRQMEQTDETISAALLIPTGLLKGLKVEKVKSEKTNEWHYEGWIKPEDGSSSK
jgi:hypothetical protein